MYVFKLPVSFSPMGVIFGLKIPFTIRKSRHLKQNRVKGVHFPSIFLNISFVIIKISMACDLSFRVFFPTITMEICTFYFRTTIVQGE